MEAFIFPIQLACLSHIQRRQTIPQWRPFSFLYSFYVQVTQRSRTYSRTEALSFLYNSYIQVVRKAKSTLEWRPLSFLYSFYIQVTLRSKTLFQNGGLRLSYTTPRFMYYTEGTVYSLFLVQLPCTSHIQRRQTLFRNGDLFLCDTASVYKSYREARLDSRMEASLFPIQLLCTCHIQKAGSTLEWRPLSSLYRCYMQVTQRRQTRFQNGGFTVSYTVAIYKSHNEG